MKELNTLSSLRMNIETLPIVPLDIANQRLHHIMPVPIWGAKCYINPNSEAALHITLQRFGRQ
jgi:hypothetical protein